MAAHSKFLQITKRPAFYLPAFVAFLVFGYLEYAFSDFGLTKGNLWACVAYFELALGLLTLVFAPIFFGLSVYKIAYFSHFEKKEWIGFLGSFFSILVTGCPACSITLATYLGLSSLLSGLPFFGYEIRVFWVLLLIGSTVYVYRTLYACHLKKAW